jgi:hypothetical protein
MMRFGLRLRKLALFLPLSPGQFVAPSLDRPRASAGDQGPTLQPQNVTVCNAGTSLYQCSGAAISLHAAPMPAQTLIHAMAIGL